MGLRFVRWFFALALLMGMAAVALADRLPVVRSGGQRDNGTRNDITVPYLTTGGSAFMGSFVAPKIKSSPIVTDPSAPGTKPVFNIIFYGSKQSFGSGSDGAAPRKTP